MNASKIQRIIGLIIPCILSLITALLPIMEIYRLFIVLVLYLITLVLFSVYLAKEPIKQTSTLSLIDGIGFPLTEIVKSARHSVFISGATLSSLCNYRDLFASLPERVKLELVLLNNDNEILLKNHCDMVEGPNTPEKLKIQYKNFLILAQELQRRKNTYIKYVDFVMPISYIGIDIDVSCTSSQIKAQHYIKNIHGGEGNIGFKVDAESNLFLIYKKQIELLRELSTNLTLPQVSANSKKDDETSRRDR